MRSILTLILILLTFSTQIYAASADEIELVVLDGNIIEFAYLSTILTSNIVVDNNSTLILRNMVVQLSVRGEENYGIIIDDSSTLILENSTVTSLGNQSLIEVSNSSNIMGSKGSSLNGFQTLKLQNASTISFVDCISTIKSIEGTTKSMKFNGTDSAITYVNVTCPSILIDSSHLGDLIAEVDELNGKEVKIGKLDVNCSFLDINGITSNEINITSLGNVSITDASVEWATVYSPINVTIVDSKFGTLKLGENGQVYNVSTYKARLTRAGGTINTFNSSYVERYWYLKVNVTDLTGFPMPAKIEIFDHEMNLVKTVRSTIQGEYSNSTMAEVITDNKTSFFGNYRLRAYFNITEGILTLDTISTEESLTLDTNREVNLMFSDVIYGLSATNITLNRAVVRMGDKVRVEGVIRLPIRDEFIEITYTKPDGTELVKAVRTQENGTFVTDIRPDMVGSWAVHADWFGGRSYSEEYVTVSRKTYVYVEEAPASFDIILKIFPAIIIIIGIMMGIAFVFISSRKRF